MYEMKSLLFGSNFTVLTAQESANLWFVASQMEDLFSIARYYEKEKRFALASIFYCTNMKLSV
jgi:hypothetical protein